MMRTWALSCPEVGFEESAVDLLQARILGVSGRRHDGKRSAEVVGQVEDECAAPDYFCLILVAINPKVVVEDDEVLPTMSFWSVRKPSNF